MAVSTGAGQFITKEKVCHQASIGSLDAAQNKKISSLPPGIKPKFLNH
jgi:hypothetical protein